MAISKANEAINDTDGEQGNGARIMGIIGVVLSLLNMIAGIILRVKGLA